MQCHLMPFQYNAAQMAWGGMIMGLLILPVSSVNLPEEENPNLTANWDKKGKMAHEHLQ